MILTLFHKKSKRKSVLPVFAGSLPTVDLSLRFSSLNIRQKENKSNVSFKEQQWNLISLVGQWNETPSGQL
jgi:hypothetical protein